MIAKIIKYIEPGRKKRTKNGLFSGNLYYKLYHRIINNSIGVYNEEYLRMFSVCDFCGGFIKCADGEK